jgi:hypothetical protein
MDNQAAEIHASPASGHILPSIVWLALFPADGTAIVMLSVDDPIYIKVVLAFGIHFKSCLGELCSIDMQDVSEQCIDVGHFYLPVVFVRTNQSKRFGMTFSIT